MCEVASDIVQMETENKKQRVRGSEGQRQRYETEGQRQRLETEGQRQGQRQ